MQGLTKLALAIELMQSYKEFIGAEKIRIDDFKNGDESYILISITKNGNVKVFEYLLKIDDSLTMLTLDGKNHLEEYAKENNISKNDLDKQLDEFSEIIKKFV